MLLRQADRKIGLSAAVANALSDPRHPGQIKHELRDLVVQRLYGLCCGYEDLNDHTALRQDPLMQTVVSRIDDLGSSSTLCRMEGCATRADGAKHAAAVIKLLVTRLREKWPKVRIIVRGDSGFCRQRLIRWCERNRVGYVIGMARNARLHRIVEGWEQEMAAQYAQCGIKQRRIEEFRYAADIWNIERRIVTRLEFGAMGANPRFIVSSLELSADELYDGLYCQRGEAENRIKETQLDLFGTRASSGKFLTNWLRVLLSGLAYTLMQRLRELALTNTDLARASAATIRVKLLKFGAAVIRNTRRVRILLASQHPLCRLFLTAARALASP